MNKPYLTPLSQGRPFLGTWLNSGSPIIAELLANIGFDFIVVDSEHSAVDLPQVQQILQAIRAGDPDCCGLVRVPGADYDTIKRFMDAGANGIICPLVNTMSQAMEVVAAVKYPPQGRRGLGFARSNMYGTKMEDQCLNANGASFVCIQIEDEQGLGMIDGILTIAGIDAVLIGPYDLTASMGIPGQFNHPRYTAAKEYIRQACKRNRVIPAIHVIDPGASGISQTCTAWDEGFKMIGYSLDITMVAHCAREGINWIMGCTPQACPEGP